MAREIQYALDKVGNFRLFWFATGSYTCKCTICGEQFTGDKRSVQCLKCALLEVEKLTHHNTASHEIAAEIDKLAAEPCEHGYVPIFPKTLFEWSRRLQA